MDGHSKAIKAAIARVHNNLVVHSLSTRDPDSYLQEQLVIILVLFSHKEMNRGEGQPLPHKILLLVAPANVPRKARTLAWWGRSINCAARHTTELPPPPPACSVVSRRTRHDPTKRPVPASRALGVRGAMAWGTPPTTTPASHPCPPRRQNPLFSPPFGWRGKTGGGSAIRSNGNKASSSCSCSWLAVIC